MEPVLTYFACVAYVLLLTLWHPPVPEIIERLEGLFIGFTAFKALFEIGSWYIPQLAISDTTLSLALLTVFVAGLVLNPIMHSR